MGFWSTAITIIFAHVALIVLIFSVLNVPYVARHMVKKPPSFSSQNEDWWGIGEKQPDNNNKIDRFNITVPRTILEDLNKRLKDAHVLHTESFYNTGFEWGFNNNYLRDVLSYWQNEYDWRHWENRLQKYPHYITRIEGLRIHFIHAKPSPTLNSNVRIIPLLLIHGWPGSILEFHKILPLLTTPQNLDGEKIVFEVITPSIPGYGWSERSQRPGLNAAVVARIFSKLMTRLGHERFYTQGGDWGSIISHILATILPQRVIGLHINMLVPPQSDPRYWSRVLIGPWLPKGTVIHAKDHYKVWPFYDKIIHLLQESGYFHLQATRPDTVGVALSDSPAGLAAYILEKFAVWTAPNNILLDDGGLTKKFHLDELLTNIMIYWCTGSITTSMRFYKENLNSEQMMWLDQEVLVPTGAAAFPFEFTPPTPEAFFKLNHPYLLQYTDMPRGGHFAALEEPQLLADDIFSFVNKAEAWWKTSPHSKIANTVIPTDEGHNSENYQHHNLHENVGENENIQQTQHLQQDEEHIDNLRKEIKLSENIQTEEDIHDDLFQDIEEIKNANQPYEQNDYLYNMRPTKSVQPEVEQVESAEQNFEPADNAEQEIEQKVELNENLQEEIEQGVEPNENVQEEIEQEFELTENMQQEVEPKVEPNDNIQEEIEQGVEVNESVQEEVELTENIQQEVEPKVESTENVQIEYEQEVNPTENVQEEVELTENVELEIEQKVEPIKNVQQEVKTIEQKVEPIKNVQQEVKTIEQNVEPIKNVQQEVKTIEQNVKMSDDSVKSIEFNKKLKQDVKQQHNLKQDQNENLIPIKSEL